MKNAITALFTVFLGLMAQAQKIDQGSEYLSPEDISSTLRRLSISTAYDNANGVYSKSLQKELERIVGEDHRFDFAPEFHSRLTPDQLYERPKTIQSQLMKAGADGLLTLKVLRLPIGMQITLRLFRKSDGKLFLQREVEEISKFHVKALNLELKELYDKLMASLPYQGIILSRRGRDVTINIGRRDGIKKGDEITAIQIMGFDRHPKFQFIINSKKQLLGTIRITKSDSFLSFAKIITERAPGALQVNTKIESKEFVQYGFENTLKKIPGLFGRESKEWVPEKPPTFGRVMAGFGLGRYNGTLNGTYADGAQTKNISSISSFVPTIRIEGELWINPKWLVRSGLSQSIVNTETEAGSHNISTSKLSFDVGYNMLFTDSFFGPKMGFNLGLLSYQYNVDEAGPDSLTSLHFNGWGFGVNGSFPISKRSDKFTLGGSFNTFISAKMTEAPLDSGKPKNVNISNFDVFVGYKISERIRLKSQLIFELYSAKFSGPGSRVADGQKIHGTAASNRYTTLALNVNYFF